MYNPSTDFYSHKIETSLRFNDDDNPYLSKTFGSGSQRTWTWSGWVKRNNISQSGDFFYSQTTSGSDTSWLYFNTSDQLNMQSYEGSNQVDIKTNAKFRDISSWYHVMAVLDTTQGTNTNRAKMYINGTLQTSLASTTYPSQNADLKIGSGDAPFLIGGSPDGYGTGADYKSDMYMAEVNFIDGIALDPTYFGETKEGIWIPKLYTGSYGTNGFRLQFKNSSVGSASSSTIGADTSGNNNHFASSGIVASDCALPDCPENNFATLNSLVNTPQVTFKEGNLYSDNGATHKTTTGTLSVISGKWYFEGRASNSSNKWTIGITNSRNVHSQQVSGTNHIIGYQSPTYSYGDAVGLYYETIRKNGSIVTSNVFGDSSYIDDDDIMGCAFDADSGKIWFSKNGTWLNGSAANSTTLNTGYHDTTVTAGERYVSAWSGESSDWAVNYGQDSSFGGRVTAQNNTDSNGIGNFYYAPPTGFLAMCTVNLPNPEVDPNSGENPTDYFNTVLYTGESDDDVTATNTFAADWVWLKCSNNSDYPYVQDTVRGFGGSKSLSPATANIEGYHGGAPATMNIVTTDTSIQFLGDDFTKDGRPFVAWTWKAGGSPSSNGNGSITSSVSANTDAGFSIVSYTGNGGSSATVGHGLTSAPDCIFLKNRGAGEGWVSFWNTPDMGPTKFLGFNSTGAASTSSGEWNNTAPTNTLFTIGNQGRVNTNTHNYIAYCFHNVEGYCKVGQYRGNSNANGSIINCGFRPAWILIKSMASGSDWAIYDSKRLGYNVDNNIQRIAGATEQTDDDIDLLSTGFKFRRSSPNFNNSSANFVYISFAEQPFKYANAR